MWQINFVPAGSGGECRLKFRIPHLLIVVLCGILFGINPAKAADKYTVEVLVFKTSNSAVNKNASGNEIWKEDSISALSGLIPRNKSTKKSNKPKNNPITYNTGKKLAHYLKLLKQDSNYQILKYISWSQRPLNKKRSPKVPLSSRLENDNDLPSELTSDLEGSVKFYLGTFLQLDLNLIYSPQPALDMDSPNGSTELQSTAARGKYTIRERRRVKINEINFFDHPMFGVIAVVFPT